MAHPLGFQQHQFFQQRILIESVEKQFQSAAQLLPAIGDLLNGPEGLFQFLPAFIKDRLQ